MAGLALATPAEALRASHTVSVKGELVDRWTIDDPAECGPVGGGTLTVTFQTRPLRVYPYIDKFQRNGKGSWIIGVPFGKKNVKDAPDSKATGTVTRVDNTTLRPLADGEPCKPAKKIGCGVSQLRRASGSVSRYDRNHVKVGFSGEGAFGLGGTDACGSGGLSGFSNRVLTGGGEAGALLVRMPKPSTLKRRRTVVLTGHTHKTTTLKDRLNPDSETTVDDVTRKVTVTFKRR